MMEDIQPVTQLAPMLRLPQLAPEQVAVERARQTTLLTYWTVKEQDMAPTTVPDEMQTPPIAPVFLDCSESPVTPIPETLLMPVQAASTQDAPEYVPGLKAERPEPGLAETLLSCGILAVIGVLLVLLLYYLSSGL